MPKKRVLLVGYDQQIMELMSEIVKGLVPRLDFAVTKRILFNGHQDYRYQGDFDLILMELAPKVSCYHQYVRQDSVEIENARALAKMTKKFVIIHSGFGDDIHNKIEAHHVIEKPEFVKPLMNILQQGI